MGDTYTAFAADADQYSAAAAAYADADYQLAQGIKHGARVARHPVHFALSP